MRAQPREERHDRYSDDRSERDQGRFRAQDRTESERRERRECDAEGVRGCNGPAADSLERRVAAVARQERTRRQHERCSYHREPDDQVPRWRGVAKHIREIGPQPVLEVMHQSQEAGGDERSRDANQRTEQDET